MTRDKKIKKIEIPQNDT